MTYNSLTLEQAHAKLLNSFATLVWIIPIIILVEIGVYWNTGQTLLFSDELGSVLRTLFWIVVILQIVKLVDSQLDKQRAHQIKLIDLKRN